MLNWLVKLAAPAEPLWEKDDPWWLKLLIVSALIGVFLFAYWLVL